MGKKRRTRASKIRAASRRSTPVSLVKGSTGRPDRPVKPPKTIQKEPATSVRADTRPLMTGIRPSLLLLLGLVFTQLLLWWLFSITKLDEALFELVKL